MKQKLTIQIEIMMMAVFAYLLSLIPLQFSNFDISLGIIPILLISLRRNVWQGLEAGLIWGILKLLLGSAQILSPTQAFIEYLLAFTCAGLAGIFSSAFHNKNHPLLYVILGSLTGSLARFFWHFIAGGVFWDSYAPQSINPWIFSLLINGISGLLTALVATAILILLFKMAPQLFLYKKKRG